MFILLILFISLFISFISVWFHGVVGLSHNFHVVRVPGSNPGGTIFLDEIMVEMHVEIKKEVGDKNILFSFFIFFVSLFLICLFCFIIHLFFLLFLSLNFSTFFFFLKKQRREVSINRPASYEPAALPLRHPAFILYDRCTLYIQN